jgi:hypothetical protein
LDPVVFNAMRAAYDKVCAFQNLNEERRRLAAETIIALADAGERNSATLARAAIKALMADR